MFCFHCRVSRLAGLVLTATAALTALPPARAQAEKKEGDIVTREAVCRWAEQPPVLDGKLDDPCWKQAAPIERFATFWTKTPRSGTRAYLVWDDEALYYAGTMTDREVRAFGTKRNDMLWEGDVFEVFLKPVRDRPEYFEFQANPRAVVFEMAFPRRGVFPASLSDAPRLGNEAVAVIDGTLDQEGDQDRGWTVEGRIPWTAFRLTGAKPRAGDSWQFAICRYDYGPKGTTPILMSCAPLTAPDFHRQQDYSRLRFEGPRVRR